MKQSVKLVKQGVSICFTSCETYMLHRVKHKESLINLYFKGFVGFFEVSFLFILNILKHILKHMKHIWTKTKTKKL